MLTPRRRVHSWFLALLTASLFTSGCVVNGRQVLLKEYGPTIPVMAGEALKGKTIAIKGFHSVTNLVSPDPTTKPREPAEFKYEPLSKEHDKLWSAEMRTLRKTVKKDQWLQIGNMRNGFGMVMSHVYALNDPAEWLNGSLKYDLEAQGAKVVDGSQAATADATVSGTLRLCRADMYFTINGTIVVDVEWQVGQGEVHRRQIHTHGATAAVLASEGEYFHALRDARQKVAIFIIQDLIADLRAK
jgi:hypothetical protein